MVFGFLTELYSRPVLIADKNDYQNPVGRRGFIGQPDYSENPNALHLISQNSWEGDRIIRDADGNTIVKNFDFIQAQRTSNWIRRLVPYFFGWAPYLTWVSVLTYHLEKSKVELYESTNGDLQIPAWVNAALYGTILLFSSFHFILIKINKTR